MAESAQRAPDPVVPAPSGRAHRWEALGVIIASLVGLLALLVSGYTANIQRQQVRAQVWPYLFVAYQDQEQKLTVFNKGVGPAIVRSVHATVDGKPQRDWAHLFVATGLSDADFGMSTLSGSVLSPGDAVAVVQIPDAATYADFRRAMSAHVLLDICYCSTLGECWVFEDRHPPDRSLVRPTAECPVLPEGKAFRD